VRRALVVLAALLAMAGIVWFAATWHRDPAGVDCCH